MFFEEESFLKLSDLGLVVFGAVLSWIYTALTDYRRNLKERRDLISMLHQEIKQIRIATIIPQYQPDKLFQWPYLSPSIFEIAIQSHLLNPKKDRAIIGILIILVKHICEYNNFCQIGHMIIANSLQKACYEENHKSMHDGMTRNLVTALATLKMADNEFAKITKLHTLESELPEILKNEVPRQPEIFEVPSDHEKVKDNVIA
jgi:hypothetical protein